MHRALRPLPLLAALVLAACAGGDGDASGTQPLTIYSGRGEEYVAPILERFERAIGRPVEVRYGDSGELAATLLAEGDRTPADVFLSQDAGALGALQKAGRLARLPPDVTARVDPRYRAVDGSWVGLTGRARIVAYDKRELRPAQLPASILDFTQPRWRDQIGWAPSNASFQSFVTALRRLRGDAAARRWLQQIKANGVRSYENNVAIRDAIAAGEIDVGFINHYYVIQAQAKEGPGYPVGIHYPRGGDPGSLVNVSGIGVLKGAGNAAGGQELARFLLAEPAQRYFAQTVKEYPLVAGVPADPALTPLARIPQPRLDLAALDDLQATVRMIQASGAL